MVPYGLGQQVTFEKNFGPRLGDLNLKQIENTSEETFTKKLEPIYHLISNTSKNELLQNRDLIGFVGAPWTILIYMINKISPKKKLSDDFFKDDYLISNLINLIKKFLKIHIKNQIKAGAKIIQIFDSWAGLVDQNLDKYIYSPTLDIVEYVKNLGVPVICFPRGIKNYKIYCEIVKPDMVNIDYNVDPKKIIKEIKIPIQGGLDPNVLLTDKENLKKHAEKYLNIFKDHPYVFNLGHGILPETKIELVEELISIVRNYK